MKYCIYIAMITEAVPEPPPAHKEEPPKTTGKYVPPAIEGGGLTPSSGPQRHRRSKVAPNVNSELDFPTLGGATGDGPSDT